MDSTDEQIQMKERRLLLFSTRIRFTPQTQPIRETAIDKMLEQNLLLCDTPQFAREIESQCLDLKGRPVLSRIDIEAALLRLSGRSITVEQGTEARYSLSDRRKSELWMLQNAAEQRYRNIINRLFKGVPGGPSKYSSPFLESLSIIFSELGEAYVRHLKNEMSLTDLMTRADIDRAISETKRRNKAADGPTLKAALVRFFEEIDPGFTELKWNLAQNYYVAKALGLDPSGKLLTKEIFGDGVFYIDTNVLVHSLDPTGRHHRSFRSLIESCKQLGIQMYVTQISIDEMRRVAALEKELIAKRVAEKIPSATLAKVRGILFPAYLAEVKSTGSCDLDRLFERFDKPSESLRSSYGIKVVDDRWFIDAEAERDTLSRVEQVKAAYLDRWGRKKGDRASLHDALMIRWVEKERNEQTPNTWFVTLDMSLPTFCHDCDGENRPFALTLVGLMQWLSPMASEDEDSTGAADIFSDALRQQLLPQENFFELRDFLIFSEMEMSTELLPAKDVEECIRVIKSRTPALNPADASDREKLAHEISKFFVDPGRQFKASLEEQDETIKKLTNENSSLKAETASEIDKLKDQLSSAEAALASLNASARADRLRGEAKLRLTVIVIASVLSEAVLIYFCNRSLEGPNFLQRLSKSLPFIAILASVWIVGSWFLVGKERLSALGWPFTKLLRAEGAFETEEEQGE
jgi:hypothetical protein